MINKSDLLFKIYINNLHVSPDEWKYCNTIVYKWPFLWKNCPINIQNVQAVSSFTNSGNYDGQKIEFLNELTNRRDYGILDQTTLQLIDLLIHN